MNEFPAEAFDEQTAHSSAKRVRRAASELQSALI